MKTSIYNIFTWHLQEHLMWSDQQMPFVANQFNQWRGGYSFLGVAKSILAPLLCNVCFLNVTQIGELEND